jgi:PAS domain S-box-containing protein
MATRHPPDEAPLAGGISEKALLRMVTENARIGLVVVSPDRRYVSASASYAEILGLSSSALVGKEVADVLPDVYEEQVRPRLDRAFAGERVTYELHMPTADGYRYYTVNYEPTWVDGTVALVVVVITDITDQKRAEEERRVQQTMLMTERDRAKRYLDTADVILLALDTEGRITLINRKGCELLGWTEAELLGRDWIATCVPPETRADLTKVFEGLLGGDTSTVVNPILGRHGSQRSIEWRNTVLRDDAGRVVGTFSSGADVTEQRKLEEQYHQAQKMEAVGRLAGGVAHDFNNMLTAILGYCQLLLAELPPDDPKRADVLSIHDAGENAARLTKQLLAFSRKQLVDPRPLDLNEVIRALPGMLGRIVGEDVRIQLNLAAGLARVTGDRSQMEQVIVNLAMNARDAMPDGGTLLIETANVDLDERTAAPLSLKAGRHVSLTVSDTGTGMSPEVQARLFEPFFTTKESNKGTGLGLATTHGIVTRSGGAVSVKSEPGSGSSFSVYLPQSTPAAKPTEPQPAKASELATGETILLVEDAEELRTLTSRLLERLGYRVLVAANATEAIALFERHQTIHLILSDVIMPGGSGPELTRRLVAARPGLKVIFMSGYAEDTISHHGVLEAGTAFLEKPFTAESLGRKVRETLYR